MSLAQFLFNPPQFGLLLSIYHLTVVLVLPFQRMQKDGDAVPQVDIRHMKSPTHDSQHGVGTLGLHTIYTLINKMHN